MGATLVTARLELAPLAAAHADEMYPVLADARIYEFLDYGPPESALALGHLYRRLEAGSGDDGEIWLNWVVRARGGAAMGYVQATVHPASHTYVAYVLNPEHWGHGYAHEAVRVMLGHIAAEYRVPMAHAVIEAANRRSAALLWRLGFRLAEVTESNAPELTATERLYTLAIKDGHR